MHKILYLLKKVEEPSNDDGYEVGEITAGTSWSFFTAEQLYPLRLFRRIADALSYVEAIRRKPNPYTNFMVLGFNERVEDDYLVSATAPDDVN